MSKTIEFSDTDYERIQNAAEADGMPVGAWVVAKLPLESPAPAAPQSANGRPAKTMADLLAGRVGVIDSGGDGRLSENHSEIFGEMLEEQRRAGRL